MSNEQLDLFAPPPEEQPSTPVDDAVAATEGADRSQDAATEGPQPNDQPARELIASALDDTLFVEAGAGSGKTTALVERIVQLVRSGVEMRLIAAITFTDKAALELRDRTRRVLEERAQDDDAAAHRCRAALDQVDAAAVSTLHAFAQRILSEHPVEAGLPPSIEVLDEISSQVAFDQRWRDFLDGLIDGRQHDDLLLLADALGVRLDEHLRDVATAFRDNWDLVAERLGDAPELGRPRIQAILDLVDEVDARRSECRDPDDKLVTWIPELTAWARRLEAADHWLDVVVELRLPPKGGHHGSSKNWDDVQSVRAAGKAARELAAREIARLSDQTIRALAQEVGRFTIEHVEERRTSGRLEFHDLLVLARQMLRSADHGPAVRSALAQRYQRLLLDEFQDTDPIQIELAVLIASDDPDAGSQPWSEIRTRPGRLFFVGDPKQSIYRFRRADVALFLEARNSFAEEPVRLSTNFRTVTPVIDWINGVFGELIRHEPGRQPEYQALESWRPADPDAPEPVVVLGAEAHPSGLSAEDVRQAEAADVAAAVRQALDQEWPVDDGGTSRPCRPSDITILLPARTSLPALERALEAAGVDHRAESSSLVWSTTEIRELMAVLRAVDDPSDELSVATALRSPVYGCGDDDLYRYRRLHGGSWNHQQEPPATLPDDDPVVAAMRHLADLHAARLWTSPSALVERLVRERRLLELAVARGRPRDVWRRLRFVQDQARAYVDSEGGGLRQFLAWATLQSAEGSRVAETLLPETDADAVRIMTIHASKGLEFPITILSGLTTKGAGRRAGVRVGFPEDGDVVIRMTKDLATADFDDFKPIDEQMDHLERLRLLYVAATRARDHLVVSFHRLAPRNPKAVVEPRNQSAAQLLHTAAEAAGVQHREFLRLSALPAATSAETAAPTVEPLDRAEWAARRSVALERSSTSRTLAATTIANRIQAVRTRSLDPGLQKDPRDLDLPPWNKGRYGTAIGRAVHGVLQSIDLATGAGLDATVAAQAAAEGVIGRDDVIADLARSALDHPVVRTAAASPHWRETYVAAPVAGDTVVEGYIDLLYRRDDGLVVVDYKTDAVDDDELGRRVDKYELQGATYAVALEAATGETVSDVVFLFLRRDGAVVRSVVDLDAAKRQVTEMAASTADAAGT